MQSPHPNPYQWASEPTDPFLQSDSVECVVSYYGCARYRPADVSSSEVPFPELPKELLEVTDDSAFQPSLNQLPADAFQQTALNPSQQLLNEIAQLQLQQKTVLEQMEHAQV